MSNFLRSFLEDRTLRTWVHEYQVYERHESWSRTCFWGSDKWWRTVDTDQSLGAQRFHYRYEVSNNTLILVSSSWRGVFAFRVDLSTTTPPAATLHIPGNNVNSHHSGASAPSHSTMSSLFSRKSPDLKPLRLDPPPVSKRLGRVRQVFGSKSWGVRELISWFGFRTLDSLQVIVSWFKFSQVFVFTYSFRSFVWLYAQNFFVYNRLFYRFLLDCVHKLAYRFAYVFPYCPKQSIDELICIYMLSKYFVSSLEQITIRFTFRQSCSLMNQFLAFQYMFTKGHDTNVWMSGHMQVLYTT